ncbi:WD repeat-containing protein 60 [Phytophthora pseudosyringae]|uniref:WD repeat-containing protein 60 n=1 Tax=Phytophthora pseudosyringae TaxID=221518 RepID=A0A8T1VNC8_9STRA|nr:WD repeat-containing protein 60 [Phytophthora pseudosyringae]
MSTELPVVPSAEALRHPSPSHGKPKANPNKKKPASTAKKSRGWGPFHSVLKERSVDFNLTLDVQNLQQQVRDLSTLRDLLSTQRMVRRHSPEGSLFHVVKEYLEVFRSGWAIHETGREQDQRAFLHSVMDPKLDVGNGLRGPDVMAEQIIRYSTFIKFIRVTLQSTDIVVAEDAVIIETRAKLRFRILRNTIEMVFPHVIGDEWLVAQLVGQEVEPSIGITFSFNAEGKCCKYEFEVDFMEAFAGLVKDPSKLEMLLGQALIADNCMLGLIDEPGGPSYCRAATLGNALEGEHSLVEELSELHSVAGAAADRVLYQIVNDYYVVFAKGYGSRKHEWISQDDFVSRAFVPERAHDAPAGGKYTRDRWQALSECFDVLEFRQTSAMPIQFDDQDGGVCVIQSTGSYALGVTMHTLESAFPHVLSSRPLVDRLVGKVLLVPSELVFRIEMDTRRIARVVERMDFVQSMAAVLQSRQELSFVMSHALLSLDGVSCNSPARPAQEETCESVRSNSASDKRVANARAMTMADILTA